MNLNIRGHNLTITQPIREYAEKKFSKLKSFFSSITDIMVELEVGKVKNKDLSQIARANIHLMKGIVIRGEERSGDIYSALDLLAEKMTTPLKKYHDRFKNKHKSQGFFSGLTRRFLFASKDEDVAEKDTALTIKKEPRVAYKPMDPVEAVLQLNKTKNSFYVFHNTKTHHAFSIVYDRHNGTYGLQTYKKMYLQRAGLKKFKDMPAEQKYEGDGVKITKIKELKAEAMSPDEAAQQLSGQSKFTFLTFTNKNTGELNVVYHKKGNNFGLIEPIM